MNDLVTSDSMLGDLQHETSQVGDAYTLGTSKTERDRLRQQRATLHGHSRTLLDRVGIEPGWSALDLGCGPGGILDLLSERVGTTGSITGLDVDADSVTAARAFACDRGLGNVQVIGDDARATALPGGAFDLVHTRLVLVNVSRPTDVVAEMVRLARPGGYVAALEADVLGLCYPSHPAVDSLTELLVTATRHDGADPHVGRRLPEMFRAAGLTGVQAEARTDVYEVGHPQRTVLLDLVRAMSGKIVTRRLATESDLDELDAAARGHLRDRQTVVVPVIYFLAWGRKPCSGPSDR